MSTVWIELAGKASITIENGLLVVDFTSSSYANRHESVRYHYRADGALVVESEQQRWKENTVWEDSELRCGDVPLANLHPSQHGLQCSETHREGWWWNRRVVVRTYIDALMVRHALNQPRRLISNHYAFIFDKHAD
jgi:hypothetical protein